MPVLPILNKPNQVQSLAFSAQYIQTSERIKAGKANSSATFNLVYN